MSVVTNILAPQGNLQVLAIKNDIQNIIINELSKIKLTYPTDVALIHYISLLVENLLKPKSKIDKLHFVFDIIKAVFPAVTDNELVIIGDIIHYLLSTKMVSKIPFVSYVKNHILSYILKKKALIA